MTGRKNALRELQSRKAELDIKCKTKAKEISNQADYITEHIGEIAIKSIIGNRFKKGKERKTEIIDFLIAEGIDVAVNIQKDPHDIKDKILYAVKKSASGLLNIFFK
jgi:hypothetical protein